MFERFRPEARRVVVLAQEQAQALGHNYVGTEHLLLGLLAQEEEPAARVLGSLGMAEEAIRSDLAPGPLPEEPDRIDPQALASIGIDFDEVRRRVEEVFGPGALEGTRAGCGKIGERLRFMPRVKKVFELALGEAETLGETQVGPEHLLLGLVREGEGLAMRILECRGITGEQIRWALLREIRGGLAS